MKTLNNNLLVLACVLLALLDSCKCNKENVSPDSDSLYPDCEIRGQRRIDGNCVCPDYQEVVANNACVTFNRDDPKYKYWKALNTNGNCFDSMIFYWKADTSKIDTSASSGMFGGRFSVGIFYYGTGTDHPDRTSFEDDGQADIQKVADGYRIISYGLDLVGWGWEGLQCFDDPKGQALRLEGHLNESMDTLSVHFKIYEMYHYGTVLGEFDQVFVQY